VGTGSDFEDAPGEICSFGSVPAAFAKRVRQDSQEKQVGGGPGPETDSILCERASARPCDLGASTQVVSCERGSSCDTIGQSNQIIGKTADHLISRFKFLFRCD